MPMIPPGTFVKYARNGSFCGIEVKSDPDVPQPPSKTPPAPVEDPSDTPTSGPDAPVQDPDPGPPRYVRPGRAA